MKIKILVLLGVINSVCSYKWPTPEMFKRYCIAFLNITRLFFGAPPLEWDDDLGTRANALAIYLNARQDISNSTKTGLIFGDIIYSMDIVYNSKHEKDKLCVTLVKQLKDGIQINENLDILDNEEMDIVRQLVWKQSYKFATGEAGRARGKYFFVFSFYPPVKNEERNHKTVAHFRNISTSCVREMIEKAFPGDSKKQINRHIDVMNKYILEDIVLHHFYNDTKGCIIPKRTKQKQNTTEDTLLTNTDSLKESNKTLSDDPLKEENSPDEKKVQETDQEDVKVATTNGMMNVKNPPKIILVPVPEPIPQTSSPIPPATPATPV
ncbi:uncharacterized protein LOC124439500 [Xenia sp. Carnegie-2017]|uniref:uncharacterized protein LOC124439500 n=1 Tax=Xenia sp. Carnegie-2017 TaxID=2897299 RepID=UPI001F042551|nr:uncharacterized protein LOC124439500 [Xenia sp. Carnegie-2017]